ncbi:MAG TPA: head-tail adaptor protein, partial [Sphingomicrobium sp.]|nr:head-tail adaptor protein [Sphingomicrobium sp.]
MPEGRDRDYNSLYGFGGRPKAPRGKFDRLVTFMVPTVAETNDWNENVPGDPIETPVWAMIKSAPGTERFANAENAAVSLIRIFVRWRADLVNYTGHVKHDNRQYDVKSIQEIGRRELLEIIAVASADLYVYRIPPPANDTLPAIIGVAFPGVTLVASPGTW